MSQRKRAAGEEAQLSEQSEGTLSEQELQEEIMAYQENAALYAQRYGPPDEVVSEFFESLREKTADARHFWARFDGLKEEEGAISGEESFQAQGEESPIREADLDLRRYPKKRIMPGDLLEIGEPELSQEKESPSSRLQQKEPSGLWAHKRSFAGVAALVSLVCVLLLWQLPQSSLRSSKPLFLRAKGGRTQLIEMLHAPKTSQGFLHKRVVSDGMRLRGGDLIQFRYQLSHDAYVMVVSVSERGVISRYVPLHSGRAILLRRGEGTLPQRKSLILDRTVGRELFLVIRSSKSFSFGQVRDRLERAFKKSGRSLSRLELRSPGWTIALRLWIKKER